MSREIKFRSWNEEEKVFYYFFKGLVFDCPIKIEEYNHVGGNNFYKFNWDNAEQFTGLTDKNGKDIFDCDKVKVNGEICYINFHDGAFYFTDEYRVGRRLSKTVILIHKIEVIGNIHE